MINLASPVPTIADRVMALELPDDSDGVARPRP